MTEATLPRLAAPDADCPRCGTQTEDRREGVYCPICGPVAPMLKFKPQAVQTPPGEGTNPGCAFPNSQYVPGQSLKATEVSCAEPSRQEKPKGKR